MKRCLSEVCCAGCAAWLKFSSVPLVSIASHSPQLEVHISYLSGESLCAVIVESCMTVDALKYDIQVATKIPRSRQRLIFGTGVAPLENHVCMGDLADKAGRIALKLIQMQKPLPVDMAQPSDPMVLHEAIKVCDVERSLALLTLENLPGLNETDIDSWTVLHHAAWQGLDEVCQTILERTDFTNANSQDISGLTALHCASHRGHLGAVRALLMSDAFTDIDSWFANSDRTGVGWSARDIAEIRGHAMIVEAIDVARRKRSQAS